MKSHKQFEAYIHSVIKKFIPRLLLQRHTFKVESGAESEGDSTLMCCLYNYPYLNVTIKYSEKAYKKWLKGEDLTEYIVHEMCHPITDPFYSKSVDRYVSKNEILDERERLTDLICNITLKAYE